MNGEFPMQRTVSLLSGLALGLAMLSGCDYDGDWLFAGAVEGVPGVVDLGTLTPVELDGIDAESIRNATIFGEIGPSGTTQLGGVTFNFQGTGSAVCAWVDPELVSWNQSVSPTSPNERWTYPDNLFDDGDLDMFAGLSVFYTGAPGERLGNFVLTLEDELGNEVEVSLSECNNLGYGGVDNAHPGRGQPESCTIFNTQPGVSYTVVLQTWSTPLDDDRLGYGVLLTSGTCADLTAGFLGSGNRANECLITGEAIEAPAEGGALPQGADAAAAGLPENTWLGSDEIPSWGGSVAFEEAYCTNSVSLAEWCQEEADLNEVEGVTCDWTRATDPLTGEREVESGVRCYCGDPDDTPTPGSF